MSEVLRWRQRRARNCTAVDRAPPYGDQPKGKPTGWFQDEARILDKFNLAARHQARLPLRTGTPPGHAGSTSRNDAALK